MMTSIKSILLAGMLIFTAALCAHAADVTITVNGRVVAKPCTVATPSATVDLGTCLPSIMCRPVPAPPGTPLR